MCNFFGLFSAANAAALQFTNVGGVQTPNPGLATEAAKFGDVDLDGDLDLVYANGGDIGLQQSKLLINRGLLQGGPVGFYQDRTSAQLLNVPGTAIMAQSSRDVQIFDIDCDGDLNIFFSNHSQLLNQSNTWFINQGLAQGGTPGEFILSMDRWVVIGRAGSSIPIAQKIIAGDFSGGFVDYSCQAEFADVDHDGDLDLYHTSYGQGFSSLLKNSSPKRARTIFC